MSSVVALSPREASPVPPATGLAAGSAHQVTAGAAQSAPPVSREQGPPDAPAGRHLHVVPEPPMGAVSSPAAPTGMASDLLATAAHVLQLLVDIHAGIRPAHQALHWTEPAVYRTLLRREQRARSIAGATLTQGRHSAQVTTHAIRGQVQSVRVCRLSEDIAEISAVVWHTDSRGQHRAGAIAVRIDQRDGQWRASAVEAA